VIHGLDTGFLVAAEVGEHTEHSGARDTLARLVSAGDLIAVAPQVLAEFIHIVTDPRRFAHPLDMTTAHQLAEQESNRSSPRTRPNSAYLASSPASSPRLARRALERCWGFR
jgi:predicted nucleic acid-binding protein